jgi:hypothetical protein
VLAILRTRRGRGQAIRAGDLASLAGIEGDRRRRASPREVQHIIRRLREQHGVAVCSTAGRPPGYYMPATPEELERCIREQRRKAISTLVVLRALRRHRAALAGQLALGAGEQRRRGAEAQGSGGAA